LIVATTTKQRREAPGSGGFSLSRTLDRHFLVVAAWPSLIVMALVTAIPFVVTIGLSLTNYDLIRSGWQFIGFDNFAQLASDPNTKPVVLNTIYLVLATTIVDTTIGLGLAVLMESRFRGIGIIRSLYLLPIMTAGVIVAMTWKAMFNNNAGWINYFLGSLHLPQPTWLGDPFLAMPAVIISDAWTGICFQSILLLAGLLSVSQELKEAAIADGASRWQVFRHVELPSIRPVLFVVFVLKFIDEFKKFEGIQLLTSGGPGYASTTLNLQIYNVGLFYDRVGYAAAYGVIMVALIGGSVAALFWVFRKSGD
jgi:multiple sugar transport system permease protein